MSSVLVLPRGFGNFFKKFHLLINLFVSRKTSIIWKWRRDILVEEAVVVLKTCPGPRSHYKNYYQLCTLHIFT